MASRTYNPKKITVAVGSAIITGFAESFVKVSRASDAFTKVVGADGEVARTASADMSGEIVITLMQTSMSNDALTALHNVDVASNLATVPVVIKDINGATLLFAPEAWIKKVADVEYGAEAGEREWTLETGNLMTFVGGTPNI